MWPCQRSSYSLAAPRRLGSASIWDRELPSSITMICWTQPRASKQHTLASWVAFTSTLGFSTYLQRLRSSTCRGISTKDRRMAATGQSRRPSPSCSTPAEPTGGKRRRRRSRRRTRDPGLRRSTSGCHPRRAHLRSEHVAAPPHDPAPASVPPHPREANRALEAAARVDGRSRAPFSPQLPPGRQRDDRGGGGCAGRRRLVARLHLLPPVHPVAPSSARLATVLVVPPHPVEPLDPLVPPLGHQIEV